MKKKNVFDPKSKVPFRFSRTKIELFMECPRCFYLDRRLGVPRPPSLPFSLNSAVDALLKKEFDLHRAKGEAHPLMKSYKIKALPFQHEKMETWRNAFYGVEYLHPETNFKIFGAVDDIWINSKKELQVVEYKATATSGEVSLEEEYRQGYKRQVEIYQWLLRKNGFKVSDLSYFIFANGQRDKKAFDGKLEFDVKIIPYQGDDSWVDDKIKQAYQTLILNKIPGPSLNCKYCQYQEATKNIG